MTENIHPQLKRLAVKIEDLVHDPANARIHPERNLKTLQLSLEKYGQMKPVIVQKEGMIIRAGNGLVEAASNLGWEKVAAVIMDKNDLESTAYAITDNKSALTSDWDFEILSKILPPLLDADFDIDLLGWEQYELDPILSADWDPPEEGGDEEDPASEWKVIKLTNPQWKAFSRAYKRMQKTEGEDLPEGKAVEILAKAFMKR